MPNVKKKMKKILNLSKLYRKEHCVDLKVKLRHKDMIMKYITNKTKVHNTAGNFQKAF